MRGATASGVRELGFVRPEEASDLFSSAQRSVSLNFLSLTAMWGKEQKKQV